MNNPRKRDKKWLDDMECSYVIFQLEKGKKGTRHLQGFVQFDVRKKFSTVRKTLPKGCHIEKMRGTSQQASDYCEKKDTRYRGPWKRGTLKVRGGGQGQRNDLLEVKSELDSGRHLWDVAREDASFPTVIRYAKTLSTYENVTSAGRTAKTICIVHYGESGTGKTTIARLHKNLCNIQRGNSGLWWDNYRPSKHSAILLDEFSGHTMAINEFKRLVDRAPLTVDTKGGCVNFRANTVILTSNDPPEMWWKKNIAIHWPAIQRRLDHVFRYSKSELICVRCDSNKVLVEKMKGSWKAHGYARGVPKKYRKEDAFLFCIACKFDEEEVLIKEDWF